MLDYQVQVTVREGGQALVDRKFEVHDPALIKDSERKAARVVLLDAAISVLTAELAKNIDLADAAGPPETHSTDGA